MMSKGPWKRGTNPRLMVVSNRLPVRLVEREDGTEEVRASSGGLVTALRPVLNRRGGSWTGWPGTCGRSWQTLQQLVDQADARFDLMPVPLTIRERDDYYLGFSNQALWPLFHGFPSKVEFRPEQWSAYQAVNWKFGRLLAPGRRKDSIWIQDYHLMLMAQALRLQGCRLRLGFFLHTPFPSPDVLQELPTHKEILQGLLHFDALGFQTERDRHNFQEALDRIPLKAVRPDRSGRLGSAVPSAASRPISVDFDEWSEAAASSAVTRRVREIRESLDPVTHLLLGVDRLDYTKGIPAKLRGLRKALRDDPELRGKVKLIQLVVPSREGIPAYQEEKARIDKLFSGINEELGTEDWQPVQLIHGEWDREELMAHYRAADVALVTPIRDGMNLVSKEFCAARVQEPGSLVLSKHAGAANQLGGGAVLVEPQDDEDVARGIRIVVGFTLREARERMAKMRRSVLEEDVHWWAESSLRAMEEVGLKRTRTPREVVRWKPARSQGVNLPPVPPDSGSTHDIAGMTRTRGTTLPKRPVRPGA